MLAIGLAGVPFLNALYEKITEVSVDLPETVSSSPLIVSSKYRTEIDDGGGSGPHSADDTENTEVVNTLGGSIRPHIIENAELPNAMLRKADLNAARIDSSNFSGANFRKATFLAAVVSNSSFMKSDFRGADLTSAQFYGSDFTGADFSNAKLTSANLGHTDFSHAVLTNADLTDANLSNARLESAKGLSYAQLNRALIGKFTTLPAKWESKRALLLARSRARLAELRKEKSARELERLTNQFDFLE